VPEKQQIPQIQYQFFSGPNIHASKSVVHLNLRIGKWLNIDATQIASGYRDALIGYFPILEDDADLTYSIANGGNIIGQTFQSVTKALLHLSGVRTPLVGTLKDNNVDACKFFFGYDRGKGAVLIMQLTSRIMRELANRFIDPDFSVPINLAFHDECIAFMEKMKKADLSSYQRPLMEIAEERDIPWQLTPANFLLFGQGKYQRTIQQGFTDRTSFFGVQISTDKKLTNQILRQAGLPVPVQVEVKTSHAAVKAAQSIGYPVVVKPLNADFGNGVSVKLETEAAIISAFDLALKFSDAVIVENYIPGEDHRLLIIDGEVTSVAKRIPAHVNGDGWQTIGQLVEEENRRRANDCFLPWALQPLKLDEGALQHLRTNQMSIATVPELGQ
jgi:cyanophycin synthetase